MGDRGYRRDQDSDSDEEEERQRRRRERHRDRERARKKQAHASTDSSADLLADSRRRRESTGYRRSATTQDEDSSARSPQTRRHHRDDSSQDKPRRARRESQDVVEVVEYVSDRERRHDPRERAKRDEDERRRRRRRESRDRDNRHDTSSRTRTAQGLSAGGLAALDAMNEKLGYESGPQRVRQHADEEEIRRREEKRRRREEKRKRRRREDGSEVEEKGPDVYDEYVKKEKRYEVDYVKPSDAKREKGRVVSGQRLEKGHGAGHASQMGMLAAMWPFSMGGKKKKGRRGKSTYSELSTEERALRKKRRKRLLIVLAILVIILAIAIAVGVVVSKKSSGTKTGTDGSSSDGTPTNSNLKGVDPNSVPQSFKGGWMDPFSWYDTDDFNVTFTDTLVGGLPIIGLNSTWDDSTRANDRVPALNSTWDYGSMPMRGINVGGWLSNEPLITPSFYSKFKTSDGVVDEYTLSAKLAPATAKTTFETHYSSFIREQDFRDIQDAGFDHVRIPFGYWAVTTYSGDPYVSQISWRYLLRAIEWARKYGLRINLDLHGAPGSQNGWNHSGRQGQIGWLNGTDGALNGQRTISIHDQLSKFFSQPRYQNIIAVYGLVNEPKMTALDTSTVLQWTKDCVATVRGNGIKSLIAFGDGFMGLDNWQGKLQGISGLVLDVHQYVIFNVQQLVLNHRDKTNFACGGWSAQAKRSMNTATGFGPTIFAEWSQADTDCATYLNNVGVGSRWEGTLNFYGGPGGSVNGSVLTPTCPTGNNPRCSCAQATSDPGQYSATYKQWLLQFAVAQMHSFEQGWGWFYWTWKTESSVQWSYRDGLKAGILPSKVWDRDFDCTAGIPDYAALGLPEYY